MQKWQYRLIRIGLGRKGAWEDFQTQLNELGFEGWEAAGISGDMNGGAVLFKRPLE